MIEQTKENLEIEKLRLEIAYKNLPWHKKSEYLTFVLPLIIAFGTLLILFLNGDFNNKNELLQIRKERLELEIKKSEDLLASVTQQIKSLEGEMAKIEKQRVASIEQQKELLKQYDFVIKQYSSMQKLVDLESKKLRKRVQDDKKNH